MTNDCPIVLVHGLFGWGASELLGGGFPYWGTGHSVRSRLPRYEASVGPISSLHDRACELAFQIKGGRVDYGGAHAAEAGHARYGRTYESAFHPTWSAKRPVHLVGHSMGASTAVLLQQLLAEDFFDWDSTDRWVASISSLSGVLNGTTATYFFGCDPVTGLVKKEGAAGHLGHAIETMLRATGDRLTRAYDFHLDQWGLGLRGGEDLPNYVTEKTMSGVFLNHAYPQPGMNPFLIPSALYVGQAEFETPFFPSFNAEDWWPNDGLVSTYSQMYPRIAGDHPVRGVINDAAGYVSGGWYYQLLHDRDHIDLVALPSLGKRRWQKRFYKALFNRLAHLDLRPSAEYQSLLRDPGLVLPS